MLQFRFNPDIDKKMETLFLAQEKLYEAGARNFLFTTVPPMERSPGAIKKSKYFDDYTVR